MLRLLLLVPFFGLFLLAAASARGQEVRVLGIEELKARMAASPDKVLVVNFWATWCRPCVAELPHFEALGEKYKSRGVEVLLVSIDSPSELESKLRPFVARRGLKSEVVLLNETDPNRWIPQLSDDWDGVLPCTTVVTGGRLTGLKFHPRSFTYAELEQLVAPHLPAAGR